MTFQNRPTPHAFLLSWLRFTEVQDSPLQISCLAAIHPVLQADLHPIQVIFAARPGQVVPIGFHFAEHAGVVVAQLGREVRPLHLLQTKPRGDLSIEGERSE